MHNRADCAVSQTRSLRALLVAPNPCTRPLLYHPRGTLSLSCPPVATPLCPPQPCATESGCVKPHFSSLQSEAYSFKQNRPQSSTLASPPHHPHSPVPLKVVAPSLTSLRSEVRCSSPLSSQPTPITCTPQPRAPQGGCVKPHFPAI